MFQAARHLQSAGASVTRGWNPSATWFSSRNLARVGQRPLPAHRTHKCSSAPAPPLPAEARSLHTQRTEDKSHTLTSSGPDQTPGLHTQTQVTESAFDP